MTQHHGQRIYGGPPPDWSGSPPSRGTEIYCYRIPRDCFEDELVPVFTSIGKIFEMRLMVEFSGANRSYCYVRYCQPEDARKAIATLHNYEIRPGYPLAVTKSVDNRKLCIKTVPAINARQDKEVILREIGTLVDGVTKVTFIATRWLQVEFESHRLAALARRQLVPGDQTLFGKVEIRQVDWADPEQEVSHTQDQEFNKGNNKIIMVKNLPNNATELQIKHWFNILTEGAVDNVVFTTDSGVLITFMDEAGAMKAIERGSQATVGNVKLELSWWQQRQDADIHRRMINQAAMDMINNNHMMARLALPPPAFEGPLERLHHLSQRQGWGIPQYDCFTFDNNGQKYYQYCVQVPNVPGSKIFGDADPDKHQALMECAKKALQGIVEASNQIYKSRVSQQPVQTPLAGPYYHYRTPAPSHAPAHTLLQPSHSRRRLNEGSINTVVRPVEEEIDLLVEHKANVMSSLDKSMENMSVKPILAVPPNIKKGSGDASAGANKLLRCQSQTNLFENN